MSLPSTNFLHLTVSEIQPGQTISDHPPARPPIWTPAHPDTMGENNTPTALKGCGVKTAYALPVRKHKLIAFSVVDVAVALYSFPGVNSEMIGFDFI